MSSTEQNILNSMQQLSVQPSNSAPPEKPTQVVTPAINRSQPSASKIASVKSSAVSPAIATIDRLLSLGTTPPPPPVLTRPADMDPHTMEQLRAVKEMLAAQEEEAQSLRDINREMRSRLEECETKIKKLTELNEEYAEKEKGLSQRVAEKVRNNKQMSIVMEEYERTISSLIGEKDTETKRWAEERATLLRERDEAAAHLASMEHAFNDVHTKYERCKVIIQDYKTNEVALKRTVEENNDAIQKLEARYEALRQHAMQQLNKANAELDSVKKFHQAEILKLNAMLKKSEVHASSLQESLAQKIKDNEELTAICDELINKVG
ncbi:PREDICTED: transforming acidic coiled-coil-containing protein 3-like isoform X1 [Papilio xuthus]|uniref:Transforming acidic coiled-coil-containing protein 3 n=2 Tax=Papilio xuthus TaxID=66420 RepID=A0A194PG72_PAPXU|nr:PREDICTED: transforming acidic coiled-coil-containing protein 3-like isoform X1 [Papilio xuthus]KPI92386.1 Transforming acidic coiled-coil-containing protein 3 [Papilio xuthus]